MATFTPNPVASPTRTVPGTPFDYNAWYKNDPTLQALLGQINAAGLQQGTTLASGAQQIYGRLGEMPTNLSPELLRLLGPEQQADLQASVSAGNQAGTSALARLGYDYRLGQSQATNRLAGMGALRSGAYGQESAKNLRALTLSQYDTRLGAADALQQLQRTYQTGQDELAGKVGEGVTASQQRASELGQLGAAPRTVTNPYLNPAAPKQISTGTAIGSQTTYEPKPTAGNYLQQPGVAKTPHAAPSKIPSLGFRALR